VLRARTSLAQPWARLQVIARVCGGSGATRPPLDPP
jgi:hypothetical protein